jgi:hypothetical protein
MKIESLAVGLALSVAAAGCGSGAGTCGVAPCGGDVVGSWQASSACVDHATLNRDFMAGVMASCPTASIGAVNVTPSGTVTFAADMTLTGSLVASSTLEINLPAACNNGATCDQVTQVMQTIIGTNGVTGVSCAGPGSCVCTIAQTMDIVAAPGTWATSGTTLTLPGATAAGQNDPYCVQDSSLHLLDVDMATMMKVVADVVLTKQ